jgi:hypothetical protein
MGKVELNDAELVTAIAALRDVSAEQREATLLELENDHGKEAVGRARALLAVEERAAEITAELETAPAVVAIESPRVEAPQQVKQAIAEMKEKSADGKPGFTVKVFTTEEELKRIAELAGIFGSDNAF